MLNYFKCVCVFVCVVFLCLCFCFVFCVYVCVFLRVCLFFACVFCLFFWVCVFLSLCKKSNGVEWGSGGVLTSASTDVISQLKSPVLHISLAANQRKASVSDTSLFVCVFSCVCVCVPVHVVLLKATEWGAGAVLTERHKRVIAALPILSGVLFYRAQLSHNTSKGSVCCVQAIAWDICSQADLTGTSFSNSLLLQYNNVTSMLLLSPLCWNCWFSFNDCWFSNACTH